MADKTPTSWGKKAKERTEEILDRIPGGRDGLRDLRSNPDLVVESHEDLVYKNIILSHCQALLDMRGTREEKATRTIDFLIYHGVLDEPASSVPQWRGGRYIHLRNRGCDALEAISQIVKQEEPGTTAESVLQSVREFKRLGGRMVGWSGEDFSTVPGLTSGKVRKPNPKPRLDYEDSDQADAESPDLSPEAAKAGIAELCRDPDFMDAYMSGGKKALARMTHLHKCAFPEAAASE